MKVIDGEFTESIVVEDETPLLPKLKLYALQHPNIHLGCEIFTTQVCICRNEDGSLKPEIWTDELILAGLNQQLEHHFAPNLHPYAEFTFLATLGMLDNK